MRRLLVTLLTVAASPAFAQEREYCPERPGLDTPACIVDRGRVSVETALLDWTLDRQPDSRTDTVLIGDTLVRLGVTDTLEARVGWTPYGHERVRDRRSGAVDAVGQAGDVSLGVKASLHNPDGSGLSVAALPYVTLPVGGSRIGEGAVGAGLLIPVTYALSDAVQLDVTPEVDAQPNADRSGRHLRYSAAGGATVELTRSLSAALEGQVIRDRDPDDRSTQTFAALSLAWQVRDDLQLDAIGVAGLDAAAPDVQLAFGVSRRF